MTGSAIRPDDGNWRMLSSREREYLANIESEAKRAGQLGINCEWLIARLDEIHDALCPGHIGTWQSRTQKAVEAAKTISQNSPICVTASNECAALCTFDDVNELKVGNAAPELLEALQEIIAAADGEGWSQLDAGFTKARAAVAKALGND